MTPLTYEEWKDMQELCLHRGAAWDRARDIGNGLRLEWRECLSCGAWLSLGDSDEHASPEVIIEIAAACIAAGEPVNQYGLVHAQAAVGVMSFDADWDPPDESDATKVWWHAGYLARAIVETP